MVCDLTLLLYALIALTAHLSAHAIPPSNHFVHRLTPAGAYGRSAIRLRLSLILVSRMTISINAHSTVLL